MRGKSLTQEHGRYPLIGPDDPPPFTLVNDSGGAKALLVGDHASRAFPKNMMQLGLDEVVMDQHVTWDIGTNALIHRLSKQLDAPAILAGYSRLIVDTNRSLEDPTAIPVMSDGILIPGNQGLTDDDRALRVQSFYQPYRDAIEDVLNSFRHRGITPAFIAIHSFTPEMGGFRRPWHIGVLWDVDPRLPLPLMEKLNARPDVINVGDNEPYSGRHPADFTIDHHAESAGLPHVSIEVRQDLIDTDPGVERWAGILGDVLEEILADEDLYTVLER